MALVAKSHFSGQAEPSQIRAKGVLLDLQSLILYAQLPKVSLWGGLHYCNDWKRPEMVSYDPAEVMPTELATVSLNSLT